MSKVKPHFKMYGAVGVPKGLVDAHTFGHGSTPCLPHSRMTREEPMITEIIFPKAERAMRKLRALEDFFEPKTALKKRDAASCLEVFNDALGTAAKYATLQSM